MSLERIQTDIAQLLKTRRSSKSFVGGSIVFNKTYPRRSADMDIYVENASLPDIAADDIQTLRDAGYTVEVRDLFHGLVIEAKVGRDAQSTLIEWNEADRERFFPVVEDPVFGWTLHPIDLAVQKLVASATRREARDCVDILLLDHFFAPLSALAIAAPAKLSGSSPTSILDRALRNGIGHRQQDFAALAVDADAMPFQIDEVKTILADVIDRAIQDVSARCNEAEAGFIYCAPGLSTIEPPLNERLPDLDKHGIAERGPLPLIERNRAARPKPTEPQE